jgi:hypothetical protein
MASIIYYICNSMYSLTAPAPATAAPGMWYYLCAFFILLLNATISYHPRSNIFIFALLYRFPGARSAAILSPPAKSTSTYGQQVLKAANIRFNDIPYLEDDVGEKITDHLSADHLFVLSLSVIF